MLEAREEDLWGIFEGRFHRFDDDVRSLGWDVVYHYNRDGFHEKVIEHIKTLREGLSLLEEVNDVMLALDENKEKEVSGE